MAREGVFEDSVRLRAFGSDLGEAAHAPATVACVSAEQSAGAFEAAVKHWPWLRVDRLLWEYRISQGTLAVGRRRFKEALEQQCRTKDNFGPSRPGWFLAAEALKRELLATTAQTPARWHYDDARASAEAQAEGILAEKLSRCEWSDSALAQQRKGDAAKVVIAKRLRRETTMTLACATERFGRGTKMHLAHFLYWRTRNEK